MSKVHIEEIRDVYLEDGESTVFIKCTGMGVDYYQRIIFNHLFENLQASLSTKQA